MRTLTRVLLLCAGLLCAQQAIPKIEGETLSGKKVSLPADLGSEAALLIIGFTHGSQAQTKAWGLRVHNRFPAWSVAVLEDVPRLVRGMVTHGIKGSVPKEQYDRFILVYHGEKELKQAAGFDRPDDAYLLVIDRAGAVHWSFHGPVTDAAVEQISQHLNH
ncbi:MAG TPA: hypothetical protein VKB88_34855 [Bryobacteraceae bacterium]|nr:hypothetical protein [Bryobacteraceae bacterium]